MPMYDLVCENGHEQLDKLLGLGERPPCPECGTPTSTLWRNSNNVVGDDIPGGVLIFHGICNPDGSPCRYYSKSDMAKEAKRRGLVNLVEHKTDPKSGSDKNPHTTRWI
jgi:hypothetical protein